MNSFHEVTAHKGTHDSTCIVIKITTGFLRPDKIATSTTWGVGEPLRVSRVLPGPPVCHYDPSFSISTVPLRGLVSKVPQVSNYYLKQ